MRYTGLLPKFYRRLKRHFMARLIKDSQLKSRDKRLSLKAEKNPIGALLAKAFTSVTIVAKKVQENGMLTLKKMKAKSTTKKH